MSLLIRAVPNISHEFPPVHKLSDLQNITTSKELGGISVVPYSGDVVKSEPRNRVGLLEIREQYLSLTIDHYIYAHRSIQLRTIPLKLP
ncbi:hypothetical protein AtNW77_Chr3g0172741 [Arabidopsis thaliana]